MQILAAIALTVLPGSWIMFGLRLSGISSLARLALAVALSPAVVGLQLVSLEAIGFPFAVAAKVLVLLNLPSIILLVRHHRTGRVTCKVSSWLSSIPLVALLIGIPILIWSLIPGSRAYSWNAMIHTDIVYVITRDGWHVEETNLAGLNLAYGWIAHGYWSVISWIGDWAPTIVYPFTNVLWIIVTFVLSYQLGKTGLSLYTTTALFGAGVMFLGTNVAGMVLRIVTGYSQWWEHYFGDLRYTPFLNKYYGFEVMPWGMSLLVGIALLYTIAIRKRVAHLEGLTVTLLVGLGLVYPVLFPAGLIIAGSFIFLKISRIPKHLPKYTHWEITKFGFALLLSVIIVSLYLGLITTEREVGSFALSGLGDIRNKLVRALGALGPFMVLATPPFIKNVRLRNGPALMLMLSALSQVACYIVIDLAQLEYKYVLAATICLAFLAVAFVDPFFRRHQRIGLAIGTAVSGCLAVINIFLIFQNGGYIPGNVSHAPHVDEGSFWISLSPSDQDSAWTTAIHEFTVENTVVIARKPGVQLSVLVGRSMYVPSDTEGGQVPGYNLKHRSHLIYQRGYSAEIYDRRLGVVETIYTSEDDAKIIDALHYLNELSRPVAIYFPSQDTYSLRWLEAQAIGRNLFSDDQKTVWLVEDLGILP